MRLSGGEGLHFYLTRGRKSSLAVPWKLLSDFQKADSTNQAINHQYLNDLIKRIEFPDADAPEKSGSLDGAQPPYSSRL